MWSDSRRPVSVATNIRQRAYGSRQMRISCNPLFQFALVMELADFLDSESKVRKGVWVQVPPWAP